MLLHLHACHKLAGKLTVSTHWLSVHTLLTGRCCRVERQSIVTSAIKGLAGGCLIAIAGQA